MTDQKHIEKKLGKLHCWWFQQLKEAKGKLFVESNNYRGTPYGKALSTLIKKEYIKIEMCFEQGGVLLSVTETGKGFL